MQHHICSTRIPFEPPTQNVTYSFVQMHAYIRIFVQVYITECVGVKSVGFSSMCFSMSSAVGSLFIGKILSHALMAFLLAWDQEPNPAVIFNLLSHYILWGFCNSIWNTVTTTE